jgi:hypothetical protein
MYEVIMILLKKVAIVKQGFLCYISYLCYAAVLYVNMANNHKKIKATSLKHGEKAIMMPPITSAGISNTLHS